MTQALNFELQNITPSACAISPPSAFHPASVGSNRVSLGFLDTTLSAPRLPPPANT
ncbi:hypothetical protein PF002_g33599 [Phytophthora fragariae]|uniref:Uncharacterized protein n=1 Tax=Phytophthora fragariae TaxID=53985 RepID=A0A6A3V0I8_9STRA|nr:hypothetical protein PF002_g33599 [Phytophthora fragariae]